jgi:methanogenic corrinoid protein MtbC1
VRRSEITRQCREAYLAALLAGEIEAAEIAVREGIEAGLDEATVQADVITPAMHEIGRLWRRGVIGVADEHLATHMTMRVLALQRESFRLTARRSTRRVLLAAVELERHTVGLEMAANLLLHAGYDVRLLGSDVPPEALGASVRRHEPDVVGLSVTLPEPTDRLARALQAIAAVDPTVPVMVGGQGVPPGTAAAEHVMVSRNVAEVVDLVDALVHHPWSN